MSPTSLHSIGLDLLQDILPRCGSFRVRVQGSSMLPALRPGDEVRIEACSCYVLRTGEIVAFRRGERLFVHRLIGRDARGKLLTQGDALAAQDLPVDQELLLGRITGIERAGNTVALNLSSFNRAAAYLFRHSRFCAALFLKFASL